MNMGDLTAANGPANQDADAQIPPTFVLRVSVFLDTAPTSDRTLERTMALLTSILLTKAFPSLPKYCVDKPASLESN